MHHRVALVATMLGLVSCSGGAEKGAPADSTSSSAAPPVVNIIARDFAFEAPDTIAGGMVTIRMVNAGPELHHVQLLRLTDGKTFEDFGKAMKEMAPGAPPPAWIKDVGGPNSPAPGGEQSLTQELEPGNYALVCFIDTPDKVPHLAKGMMRPLTVVAPTGASAAAPAADVTVRMTDYAWQVTPALTSGKHVLKLENAAAQSHELFLARLDSGKTADDLMKWAESYAGKPPATPMGGVSAMAAGAVAYLPVDLPAGEYVLLCFVPDAKDGKPHIAHGMMTTMSIN